MFIREFFLIPGEAIATEKRLGLLHGNQGRAGRQHAPVRRTGDGSGLMMSVFVESRKTWDV